MRYTSPKNTLPSGNPIANALVVIVGVLIIAASLVLGFFAFIALSAVVLVTAAIVGIRLWWLRRKAGQGRDGPDPAESHVIEGEYRVVHRDSDEA